VIVAPPPPDIAFAPIDPLHATPSRLAPHGIAGRLALGALAAGLSAEPTSVSKSEA